MIKKVRKYSDYDLVPETKGKITDGVYLRKDKKALIISFTWGDDLRFCPEDEIINRPDFLNILAGAFIEKMESKMENEMKAEWQGVFFKEFEEKLKKHIVKIVDEFFQENNEFILNNKEMIFKIKS